MPGYEVFGFDDALGNPWYAEDALHCRTMGIFDPDMLHVSHKSIRSEDVLNNGNIYIEAEIFERSSDVDAVFNVTVHWKYSAEDGPFSEFPLELESDNLYSGIFPNINSDSEIEYFITAINLNGQSGFHPNTGWHIFTSSSFIAGDVNYDNIVNILDVIFTINIILGLSDFDNVADINNDGNIDILDIVQLVNIILSN